MSDMTPFAAVAIDGKLVVIRRDGAAFGMRLGPDSDGGIDPSELMEQWVELPPVPGSDAEKRAKMEAEVNAVKAKVSLIMVVNGVKHPIEVDAHAPLKHCRDRALHETKNLGQPPERWECRNSEGDTLALETLASDLPQAPALVWVNLTAGWGA